MSRRRPGHAQHREAARAAYQRVLDTPDGNLVLRDILRTAGVLHVSHTPGDPYHTAYLDGRKSLALEILERLRWSEMEIAALSRERTADRLTGAADEADAEPFADEHEDMDDV